MYNERTTSNSSNGWNSIRRSNEIEHDYLRISSVSDTLPYLIGSGLRPAAWGIRQGAEAKYYN